MNRSTENAIRNAPTDATSFQKVSPSAAGYVYSRRIIPSRPRMCIGPNVRLNPMISNQNCTLPMPSPSFCANTFGHQ